MKDALGKELKIGDPVVLLDVGRGAVGTYRGTVVAFTPKKIRVEYQYPEWIFDHQKNAYVRTSNLGTADTLTVSSRVLYYPLDIS